MNTDDLLLDQLERVDRSWREHHPTDVCRLVDQLASRLPIDRLAHLMAADIEWRWRDSPGGYRLAAEVSGLRGFGKDFKPRSVEQYLDRFPQLRDHPATSLQLVCAEFIARSRWNDPPTVTSFEDRFPALSGIRAAVTQALDDVAYWSARVYVDDAKVDTFLLGDQVEIGRQHRDEPPPIHFARESKRLVIAPHEHRSISRQQALVRRIALDRVELTNTGKNNKLTHNGRPVPPGMPTIVHLPSHLRMENLLVILHLEQL